jgi:hypothetical protein
MTIERLNQCLSEMDNLTKIFTDYDSLKLTLVFNCYGGGCYENVTLHVTFNDPQLINMPFLASGEFKFIELNSNERAALIPHDYLETNPTVFSIIVDGKDEGFYVAFDELEWFVSGSGIKNRHELLDQ